MKLKIPNLLSVSSSRQWLNRWKSTSRKSKFLSLVGLIGLLSVVVIGGHLLFRSDQPEPPHAANTVLQNRANELRQRAANDAYTSTARTGMRLQAASLDNLGDVRGRAEEIEKIRADIPESMNDFHFLMTAFEVHYAVGNEAKMIEYAKLIKGLTDTATWLRDGMSSEHRKMIDESAAKEEQL